MENKFGSKDKNCSKSRRRSTKRIKRSKKIKRRSLPKRRRSITRKNRFSSPMDRVNEIIKQTKYSAFKRAEKLDDQLGMEPGVPINTIPNVEQVPKIVDLPGEMEPGVPINTIPKNLDEYKQMKADLFRKLLKNGPLTEEIYTKELEKMKKGVPLSKEYEKTIAAERKKAMEERKEQEQRQKKERIEQEKKRIEQERKKLNNLIKGTTFHKSAPIEEAEIMKIYANIVGNFLSYDHKENDSSYYDPVEKTMKYKTKFWYSYDVDDIDSEYAKKIMYIGDGYDSDDDEGVLFGYLKIGSVSHIIYRLIKSDYGPPPGGYDVYYDKNKYTFFDNIEDVDGCILDIKDAKTQDEIKEIIKKYKGGYIKDPTKQPSRM